MGQALQNRNAGGSNNGGEGNANNGNNFNPGALLQNLIGGGGGNNGGGRFARGLGGLGKLLGFRSGVGHKHGGSRAAALDRGITN